MDGALSGLPRARAPSHPVVDSSGALPQDAVVVNMRALAFMILALVFLQVWPPLGFLCIMVGLLLTKTRQNT